MIATLVSESALLGRINMTIFVVGVIYLLNTIFLFLIFRRKLDRLSLEKKIAINTLLFVVCLVWPVSFVLILLVFQVYGYLVSSADLVNIVKNVEKLSVSELYRRKMELYSELNNSNIVNLRELEFELEMILYKISIIRKNHEV